MVPTLKTLTIQDIAKIGVFWDEYTEKFRRADRGPDYKFHKAAYRVIKGEARAYDEEMVKEFYEASVRKSFTKKGKLAAFVRINVYDRF